MNWRDANEVVDEFAREFGMLAVDEGWHLHRDSGHADRAFALRRNGEDLFRFTAKMSQSSVAFWGLGIQKAATMIPPAAEYLLLLTASDEGYFVSPTRLAALITKFSKDDHDHDYKIGEGKVRRELRFRSLEELTDLFRARLPSL